VWYRRTRSPTHSGGRHIGFVPYAHLQSLGLITLIKKKAYTIEVQSLLRSRDVARAELKRSLAEASL
jgi:hypothetical protein